MSKYDGLAQSLNGIELSGPAAIGTALAVGFAGSLLVRLFGSKPSDSVLPSNADDIAPTVIMTVVLGGLALLAMIFTGVVDIGGGSGKCAASDWRGRGLECVEYK